MEDNVEIPESEKETPYEEVAAVVACARWMLRARNSWDETDRRISADLRNVHLGLLKKAAQARGDRAKVVSMSGTPFC